MEKVHYNKLVRDGIPGKIERNGGTFEVREMTDDAEFDRELRKKIVEEATELAKAATRDELQSEYADLMVVLDELLATHELSEADLSVSLEENVERKGKFKKRLFLVWSADPE